MLGLGLYSYIVAFKKGCLHVLDKVELMKTHALISFRPTPCVTVARNNMND